MPKVCVLGASGATGQLVVQQLLTRNIPVLACVRRKESLTHLSNDLLEIAEISIADIPEQELGKYIQDCHTIISCLGHNLSFSGIWGKPRRLVTQAMQKSCCNSKSCRS